MKLEMRSQNALIGIKTEPSVQKISQPKAEQNIKTEQPKISIESTLPKVQINQQKAFSESGLKGALELGLENAKRAMRVMVQKIDRIVEEGNQMADIQNGTDIVAENADDNAFSQFHGDLNLVTMPSSGPEISVEEGKNDIKIEGGTVNIDVKINKPIYEYQRSKIQIYLKQRNMLEITAIPDKIDLKG